MKLKMVYSGALLSGYLALASSSAFAQANPSTPGNPAYLAPAGDTAPNTEVNGAMTPAPGLNSQPAVQQAQTESRRPFTVIASVREQYDDNIYTTHSNKVDAYETLIEPSILFNYPLDQTLFSARYDFGATYYPDRDPSWDLSHQFLARINHSFSDRFNIDARDRVLYSNQPEVTTGATVNRISGDYLNNTFTLQGTADWTPKFNTVTTYTNDYFHYNDAFQELFNDRDVNVLQHDFRFLLTPTLTFIVGGTFTDLAYSNTFVPAGSLASSSRDWDSYTGYVGVDYNFTPQFLAGVRGGGVLTEYDSLGSQPVNPYAMAYFNWQLGARSSLQFNYTHTMAATDLSTYASEISDNFSITGRYQFTPKISGSIQGNYNIADDESDAAFLPGSANFHEDTLGVAIGAGYDFTRYLNFNISYTYTDITSDDTFREYTRNQIALGLTATY